MKDVSATVVEGASKVPAPARCFRTTVLHLLLPPPSPSLRLRNGDDAVDFAQWRARDAQQVGTMAVDGAKTVGASAVAIGAKAADGAKSVGASAVVSFTIQEMGAATLHL